MAMNHFGDLTQNEFSLLYLQNQFSEGNKRSGSVYLEPSHVNLPTEVDWRKEGYVTGVKNQGDGFLCCYSWSGLFTIYSEEPVGWQL